MSLRRILLATIAVLGLLAAGALAFIVVSTFGGLPTVHVSPRMVRVRVRCTRRR